jgi:hypothetical protein
MTAIHHIEQSFALSPCGTSYRSYYNEVTGTTGDFTHPTTYQRYGGSSMGAIKLPNGNCFVFDAASLDSIDMSSQSYRACYNRCFGRFSQMAQEMSSAQIGVCFAEWRESAHMIEHRSKQVLGRARRVRSGFRPRGLIRTAADLWLEYSFGWSPLLNDIYSGFEVLCSPMKSGFNAKGSSSFGTTIKAGTLPVTTRVRSHKIKMGGVIDVTNPNIAMLERLGLLNPFSIAWELVPWSFVADWMFDISSMFDSWSAFAGLSISKAYTTDCQKTLVDNYTPYGSATGTHLAIVRAVGVPSNPLPNLAILDNIGSSLHRAGNALSLAVQVISGGSRRR